VQVGRALRSLGIALHHGGDLDGALHAAAEARAVSAEVGEWPTWAEATMQLAGTLAELGHLTEASQVADEALAVRDRILHPAAVAGLLNLRAEIERRRGRHDLAVPLYEESLDLLDRMGTLEAVLPRLNLAAIHALEGRYGEAWRLAERCRRESALQGRPPLEMAVRSVLLVAALGLADDQGWEQQATRILELARMGVTCESDAYALIGLACRLLRARQHAALADALASVVVEWAHTRGKQHAGELAELLGAAR
jgi:tetratricopeptide (TPR) repeat protein